MLPVPNPYPPTSLLGSRSIAVGWKVSGLVEWDTAGNMSAFRVVLIDEKEKSVESSGRILGCCGSLIWADEVIDWKAFPESQGVLAMPFNKLTV